MAGFPSISYPSPHNGPDADTGAFAGAASNAYAAGLQHASAIRYAAEQDQRAKLLAKQKEATDQLAADNKYATEQQNYRKMGATPDPGSDGATVFHQDATLQRDRASDFVPDPSTAPDDPTHIQLDSRNKAWHVSTTAETAQAKESAKAPKDTFIPTGALGAALESAGREPGKPVTYQDAHTLMQALGLAAPADSNQINTTDFNEPIAISHKTGTAKKIDLPEGVTKKPATSKADSMVLQPDEVGPNGGYVFIDKTTQKAVEIPRLTGTKTQLSPAHQEVSNRAALGRQDREDRRGDAAEAKQQGVRDRAQKLIGDLQAKEDEQHKLRASFAAALQAPDDEPVVDPRSGKEVVMNAAQRRQLQTEYEGATRKAQSFYDTKQKLVKQHGGETGPDWKPETPAPAAPTPPAAPPTGQKAAPAAPVNAPVPPVNSPVPPVKEQAAPAADTRASVKEPLKPLESWNRLAPGAKSAAPAAVPAGKPTAAAPAMPKYTDKQILVNPQTKAKVQYSAKDDKWLPIK